MKEKRYQPIKFHLFVWLTVLSVIGVGCVPQAPVTLSTVPNSSTLRSTQSSLSKKQTFQKPTFEELKKQNKGSFRTKAVVTTASGAIRRIFDNPVYSVSSPAGLTGPSNDQIFVNVGDVFDVTAIINANPGPITDLNPLSLSTAGIVNLNSATVNASGTTANMTALTVGTTTLTFSNDYYGMYFQVHITVGPGGGPPPPATIEFQAAAYSAGEGAGTMAVTIVRGGNTTPAVSATVSFADLLATGGAALPADYNNAPIVVNFAGGVTSQTINVPIFDDAAVEPTETFTMTLGGYSAGAQAGTVTSAQGNIVDDDVAANADISFGTPVYVPVFTWGENNSTFNVEVIRTGSSASAVSADITFTDGTATGGADYDNTVYTVNFPVGVTSVIANIPLTDDIFIEGSETFTMTLGNPSAGANIIAPNTAAATIVDDDFVAANDSITANVNQITFGVPAVPNAVKYLEVLGPAAETNTVLIAPPPLPGAIPNRVAFWKGENVNDEDGAFPLTAFNGATFAPGISGNALSCDGTNDYFAINLGYNAAGALPQFTVSAWVNTSFSGGAFTNNWALLDFDRSEYFNFYVRSDNGRVGFSTEPSVGGLHDMTGNAIVNDGVWHHVAVVYDGTDKIIYVDGVEDARVVNPHGGNPIGNGTSRFGIICDGSEATTFNGARNNIHYQGLIDEMQYYDRGLTAAEMTAVFNEVSGGAPVGNQITLSVNAHDNPGAIVPGVTDFVWYFDSVAPYPGFLRYPAGAAGTPNNQVDMTVNMQGQQSVRLIAESLSNPGLTDDITIQVQDTPPMVLGFGVQPAPAVNCAPALPAAVDTNCNITIGPGIHTFTANFGDANADVLVPEPLQQAYQNVFGFGGQEGVADTGQNSYLSGFNGLLAGGTGVYGFSSSGGITNKSYTAQFDFAGQTGGIPGGTLKMEVDTGSGQRRILNWNITVTPYPPDMIHRWEAEGNANDSVGTTNGILTGGATAAAPAIASGTGVNAFNLDGANDYINVPNAGDINTAGPFNEKTISLWFRTDADVVSRQMLYEQGGGSRGLSIYVDGGQVFVNGWNIVNDDGGATTPWGNLFVPSGAGSITPNTTYHVALVMDQPNGTLTGYLNGVSFGAVPGVGRLFNHSGDIEIGRNGSTRYHDGTNNPSGNASSFGGQIDDVQLYNRALSPGAIRSIFAG